jgi:adenylosuccinate synthase
MEWKYVWAEAIGAAEQAVGDHAPDAVRYVKGIAAARENRLLLLLEAMADGALDQQAIDEELKEERDILESEFLAVRVMVKKAAQDAANVLIETIQKALIAGITLPV